MSETAKKQNETKAKKFWASATKQIFNSFKSNDTFTCFKVKQTEDYVDQTTGETSEVFFIYGIPTNEQRAKECERSNVYPKFKVYGNIGLEVGEIFMISESKNRFMLVNGGYEED